MNLSNIINLIEFLEMIPVSKKREIMQLVDRRMQNIIRNEDIHESQIFDLVGAISVL